MPRRAGCESRVWRADLFHDPLWPRAGAWLAAGKESARVDVVGVPENRSISPGRCDLAPAAVRQALQMWSQADLPDGFARDLGDGVGEGLTLGETSVLIGGDNSVTYFGVCGLGLPLERVGLIQFDAHHDVRSLEPGFHNGNPIRRLIEEGLPGATVVQIGLQRFANSAPYRDYAESRGVTLWDMPCDVVLATLSALETLGENCEAIYIDLDLDVMDRAFVPGCPGARPGGLDPATVRECVRICGGHPKVRAMDLVEFDPERDINQQTALVAAVCLLEFCAGVAGR